MASSASDNPKDLNRIPQATSNLPLPPVVSQSNVTVPPHVIIPQPPAPKPTTSTQVLSPTQQSGLPWWPSSPQHATRPWRDPSRPPSPSPSSRPTSVVSNKAAPPPRRQRTIPPEQTVAYNRTEFAVLKALHVSKGQVDELKSNLIGTASHVAHALPDILSLTPFPGLAPAVKLLVDIWDSVQSVETNRMSCLRLTERCAMILTAIQEEIWAAGPGVEQELAAPMMKLVDTFLGVQDLLKKQAERPFIKRYLGRDDIQCKIESSNSSLSDCMTLFSLSIQIRTLKQLQSVAPATPAVTPSNTPKAKVVDLPDVSPTAIPPPLTPTDSSSSTSTIKDPNRPPTPSNLAELRATQARVDAKILTSDSREDALDLLRILQAALRANSDAQVIKALQIEKTEWPEAIKTLQRALEDPKLAVNRSLEEERKEEDADRFLHREFMEEGIGALRRLSAGKDADQSLPPWTITRWEIDREDQIGVGFFSEVYKGRWKDKDVAIKVLSPATPAKLFRHEVEIWRNLNHENVLRLFGASSTTASPPWFCVSPYLKHGSLVSFMKSSPNMGHPLRFIHEIAVGMEYLHSCDVLHGDLKACNVLIDDHIHCVISDFGQSELKSEAYRLSGEPLPRGTLRWLSPELLDANSNGKLTTQVDVYAFAICCIEVLTGGDLPWPNFDDVVIRDLVFNKDSRPPIPARYVTLPKLASMIRLCWSRNPAARPSFQVIVSQTKKFLSYARTSKLSPKQHTKMLEEHATPPPSPSLVPQDSDSLLAYDAVDPFLADVHAERRPSAHSVDSSEHSVVPVQEVIPPIETSEDEFTSAESPSTEDTSSVNTPSSNDDFWYDAEIDVDHDPHYESPIRTGTGFMDRMNERRYRLHLMHEFHPSLNLPLWTPVRVELGAVGYLQKPDGIFCTLFNASDPAGTSAKGMAKSLPSLKGYGDISRGSKTENKRSVAQRGLDWVSGMMIFKSRGSATFSQNVSRRHDFPVHAGHKRAILVTERTVYTYMQSLKTPKAWFTANVDKILDLYGIEHQLHKEDLYFIIGTLDTAEYGLFVNHYHPDGQVHFNVFTERREGQKWGTWTTDTVTNTDGPNYAEESAPKISANKVSEYKQPIEYYSVILARLRFKPDATEPTSL